MIWIPNIVFIQTCKFKNDSMHFICQIYSNFPVSNKEKEARKRKKLEKNKEPPKKKKKTNPQLSLKLFLKI